MSYNLSIRSFFVLIPLFFVHLSLCYSSDIDKKRQIQEMCSLTADQTERIFVEPLSSFPEHFPLPTLSSLSRVSKDLRTAFIPSLIANYHKEYMLFWGKFLLLKNVEEHYSYAPNELARDLKKIYQFDTFYHVVDPKTEKYESLVNFKKKMDAQVAALLRIAKTKNMSISFNLSGGKTYANHLLESHAVTLETPSYWQKTKNFYLSQRRDPMVRKLFMSLILFGVYLISCDIYQNSWTDGHHISCNYDLQNHCVQFHATHHSPFGFDFVKRAPIPTCFFVEGKPYATPLLLHTDPVVHKLANQECPKLISTVAYSSLMFDFSVLSIIIAFVRLFHLLS